MLVYSVTSGGVTVCHRCQYGTDLGFRIKGLLGRKSLAEDEGILLKPCNSIHMFFMKFAIDAIFLDKENRIVYMAPSIKPWHISPMIFKAVAVLEVAAGIALKHQLKVGDQLSFSIKNGYG